MTAQAFHDFSNVTRTIIWHAVHLLAEAKVKRSENRELRERIEESKAKANAKV